MTISFGAKSEYELDADTQDEKNKVNNLRHNNCLKNYTKFWKIPWKIVHKSVSKRISILHNVYFPFVKMIRLLAEIQRKKQQTEQVHPVPVYQETRGVSFDMGNVW